MNELTQKIIKLLEENQIEKKDILDILKQAYNDLELELWENIKIEPQMLYSLKDIVWYNLEHLPSNGEAQGLSNLRYLGSIFPYFIYFCNDSTEIILNDIPNLLNEIELIIKQWNIKWKFVGLYTKSDDGWHGGENPSKVIIYDPRKESPSKYGYNSNYGNILGANGKTIKKLDDDVVLCSLEFEIGEYAQGTILYNLLLQLKTACKKAIENNKNIKIEFDQSPFAKY